MNGKMTFSGKKALVMGLGLHGGGVGAVEFLMRHGAKVTVTDLRTRKELAPSLKILAKYRGIRYVLGEHRERDFLSADMILKNPGVRRDHPLLAAAERRGIPIMSDVGIFFRLCPGKIIGVTGTRGKSTTTYLIWKFLKTKYPRAHYGGNIRRSVLSILPQIKKGDLVVLELSSFQLMDLVRERKSPSVAALTNIMEDHLNWHKDMREYRDAKRAIFRFQGADDDLFLYNKEREARRLAARSPSRLHTASLPAIWEKAVDQNLGSHYRSAVALALAVGRHFAVADAAMWRALKTFRGLEGRQEEIAMIYGIHFVNDTTATIPDAAIAAITRFRKWSGKNKIILIAGGQDKKLNFSEMAREISESVDAVILLPGSATANLNLGLSRLSLHSNSSYGGLALIKNVGSMREAVRAAYHMAQKGDYILLSPGAASFGLFLNEFDRGAQFIRAIHELRKQKTP